MATPMSFEQFKPFTGELFTWDKLFNIAMCMGVKPDTREMWLRESGPHGFHRSTGCLYRMVYDEMAEKNHGRVTWEYFSNILSQALPHDYYQNMLPRLQPRAAVPAPVTTSFTASSTSSTSSTTASSTAVRTEREIKPLPPIVGQLHVLHLHRFFVKLTPTDVHKLAKELEFGVPVQRRMIVATALPGLKRSEALFDIISETEKVYTEAEALNEFVDDKELNMHLNDALFEYDIFGPLEVPEEPADMVSAKVFRIFIEPLITDDSRLMAGKLSQLLDYWQLPPAVRTNIERSVITKNFDDIYEQIRAYAPTWLSFDKLLDAASAFKMSGYARMVADDMDAAMAEEIAQNMA